MPLYLHACAAWLRQHLPWSNSRRAWAERAAGLSLLAGLIALLVFGPTLPATPRAVGAGLLLLALAVLQRRGWVTLFGPLLFYDLVRTGRWRRNILVRCLYALILLIVLFFVY